MPKIFHGRSAFECVTLFFFPPLECMKIHFARKQMRSTFSVSAEVRFQFWTASRTIYALPRRFIGFLTFELQYFMRKLAEESTCRTVRFPYITGAQRELGWNANFYFWRQNELREYAANCWFMRVRFRKQYNVA